MTSASLFQMVSASRMAVWMLLYVVAPWLVVSFVLQVVLGISIGYINPFVLKIVGVKIRDKVSIGYVQLYLMDKKVVFGGLRLLDRPPADHKPVRKREKEQRTSKVPAWLSRYFSLLSRALNNFKIFMVDAELEKLGISFNNFNLRFNYDTQTEKFTISLFMLKFKLQDHTLSEDALLLLNTKIDPSNFGNPRAFRSTSLDLKIGDLDIPTKLLMKLESQKKGERGEAQTNADLEAVGADNNDMSCGLRKIQEIANKIHNALASIDQVNLSCDKISMKNIPMTPLKDLQDLNRFLTYNLTAANFSLEAFRYKKNMPGFKISFNEDDTPIRFNSNLSGFNVSINTVMDCESDKIHTLSVLETPNISFFGSTNLLSQQFDFQKNQVSQNAVCNLKGHISSPSFDMDVENFSLMKCFKRNIKVFAGALKEQSNSTSGSTTLEKGGIFLKYIQTLIPLINFKITIEDPKVVVSDKDEFLIHRLSALIIDYKTNRYLCRGFDKKEQVIYDLDLNLEVLSLKTQHVNRRLDYERTILLLESIGISNSIKLLPDILIATQIDVDTLEVNLCDLPTLIMINKIWRKADSQMLKVEENYFMDYYEKFAKKLRNAEEQCVNIGKCMRPPSYLPSDILFEDLPPYLDYVKADMRAVKIYLGARSVFMPLRVFSDLDSQSPDDFVDGELRKTKFEVDEIQLAFYGDKTQWHSRIETGRTTMVKSAQGHLSHKLADGDLDDISTSDATEVEHAWNFNILLNSMSSSVISETLDDTERLSARKISKVSIISVKIFPESNSFEGDDSRRLIVQIDNKGLKSVISLGNLFLLVSAIHTLKQVFSLDVCSHKKESLAKKHFMALSLKKRKSFFRCVKWTQLKDLVQLNVSSEVITLILVLPSGLPTRFDIISTFISIRNFSEISLTGQHFRVSVESSMCKNYWVRMITVVQYSVNTDIKMLKDQINSGSEEFESLQPGIVLENESWHFNIPHNFEMYKIFDNIPTIFKSMKQMFHSFRSYKEELVITPKAVKAVVLPKIRLKSKRCLFSIDDDPFEADLNMIFQIGLEEQKLRVAKMEEMDSHAAAEILKSSKGKASKDDSAKKVKKCDVLSTISAFKRKLMCKKNKCNTKSVQDNLKNEEPEHLEEGSPLLSSDLEAAYERLLKNFSTSWIDRIKQYKLKEKKLFEKNFNFLWGNINYSKLPGDINKRVLPMSTNPFLTTLIIEGIEIELFQPSFGVKKIPEFISKVGKSVPETFEYSIMVPMYLDATFKEIRWHLRDYPLPFLYIPSLTTQQSGSEKDINISGDFIISEDMIQSEKEIRTVFVPLVPSVVEDSDTYYSLQVPRTITSPKFYTDLEFHINSTATTQVTWGGGYQSAIQQTMQCFDNFSKPPLDPSPKIGFWDKIRYLFHARIQVFWKSNGRFEVSLKGGQSPYKIGMDAAGFLVGFSGDVVLNCNENDDPQKFLSFTAEKVHFSIPNYFAKPLLVWSQPSTQRIFIPSQNDTNLQEYASFYYLLGLNSTNHDKADIEKMSSNYIEKTGIKLKGGVTLNVGMVFERMVPGKRPARSLSSVPHYDVRLCNHLYVKDTQTHDSYSGFRSDFIHLAFTLLSSSDNAYNAMQLSPEGLRTFKHWWKTFAGNFPVRRGKLFGEQSISPKFGEHLFTISYIADVSPLFITDVTHNLGAHLLKKNYFDSAEFAGLKAKASQFVMDLHQRKEALLEYQEELEKTKRVMRLKFLEAQVSVYGIDMRTIDATLNRIDYVEEKADGNFEIYDNDMTWYDITDFKESNFIDVENYVPNVSIKPLLYSPQFIYVKRASYGDKFQRDPKTYKRIKPFQNKLTHNCSLGKPASLPFTELEKRSGILGEFKKKVEEEMKDKKDVGRQTALKETLQTTVATMKNVDSLVKDLELVNLKRSGKGEDEKFSYPIVKVMFDTSRQNLKFENRYFICNMLLKWTEETRDVVYKFLHNFNLSGDLSNLTAGKCMHFFKDVVKQRGSKGTFPEEQKVSNDERHMQKQLDDILNSTSDEHLNEALLKMFQVNIMDLGFEIDHSVQFKHIVHFITPQIQFITKENPDACIIVTAPSIKLKTLSFCGNDLEGQSNGESFMKRFGLHLTNANLFHFHRDDYKNNSEVFFEPSAYGQNQEQQWPPWLGMELCFEPDILSSKALIKDFTSILFYERVCQLSRMYSIIENKLKNSIAGYLPKIVLSSDSRSYSSIYKMVTNLLIFIAPENAELQKQIEKLTIGLDPEDIPRMEELITGLHGSLRKLKRVEEEFLFKRQLLDNADITDLSNVRNEKLNHLLKLYIFMKVFSSNKKWADNADHSLLWNFYMKEIILHMQDEHRRPFVDLAIAKLHFERSETSTGFNNNQVSVHMAQAFDLENEAIYQNLLGPFYGKGSSIKGEQLLSIAWEMDKPIGGIKVIKHVKTDLADLTLCLEDRVIHKLLSWFLPDELHLQNGDTKEDDDDSISSSSSSSRESFDTERLDAYMNLSFEKGSDMQEMIRRSTDYVIIENLILNSFKVCISFKGSGALRLINVTDFIFSFPELVYENQTIRVIDLLVELRKILVKDMLKHTAKFIGAKVRNHPARKRSVIGSPLKQISRYESFMESQELEK